MTARQSFELLFTDVVMAGGMSGIELAREARRRRPKLKILFTSGYAEPAMAKSGLRSLKSAAWISKPYSMSELRAKLREVLAGERALSPSPPAWQRHSRRRGPS